MRIILRPLHRPIWGQIRAFCVGFAKDRTNFETIEFGLHSRLCKGLLLLFAPFALFALPTGFTCAGGDAVLAQELDGSQVVQSTGRAVIHWNDFSIGANEQVHFSQDSSQSAVLNRVLGDLPSQIDGRLTSNGVVYLMNPTGIYFGENSYVETSGLFASTLDALDEDFLKNRPLLCSGSGAPICQNGKIIIKGGDLVLLGSSVEQKGQILLQPASDPRMLIRPERIDAFEEADLYLLAIRGAAEQTSVELQEAEGRIYLVSNGKLDCSGQMEAPGGQAHLFGESISVSATACIDVSSSESTGAVYVGGYREGKNPLTKNALQTVVFPGSILRADAIEQGNGGTVVLWSDQITGFGGSISARGGENGGDGGFIEVSGPRLDFCGATDRSAPNGNAGTLLLDPYDVFITTDMTAGESFSGGTYTPIASGATINTTDLVNSLMMGNVSVVTGSSGTEPGGIFIYNDVIAATPYSLTLTATGSVYLDSGVTVSIDGTAGHTAIDFTGTNASQIGATPGISLLGTIQSANGNIALNGTGTSVGTQGILVDGGVITVADGAQLSLTGHSSHFSFSGVEIAGAVNLGSAVGATAVITGNATGGTTGTGVKIDSSAAIVLNEASTLSFVDCISGPSAGNGVLILQTITGGTGSTIEFANITGSSIGLSVTGSLNVDVIQMGPSDTTHIVGGYGSGSGQGISIDGSLGGATAQKISLIGLGNGGGPFNTTGISIISGTMQVADGGTIELNGTASSVGPGNGILLAGGAITLGSATGATAVFSGTAGNKSGAVNLGVSSTKPIIANGASVVRFENCYGGDGDPYSRGVAINGSITGGAGSILEFANLQGGSGSVTSVPGHMYGLDFGGVTIQVETIRMAAGDVTHIRGGSGASQDNAGIRFFNATVGDSSTQLIDLIAIGGGTSGSSPGMTIQGTTTIQVGSGGSISLDGTGASSLGGNYGIHMQDTSSIHTVDGSLGLIGVIADPATTEGIVLDAGASLVTTSGNIILSTEDTGTINFGQGAISTTGGSLEFQAPVILTSGPISMTTTGTISFSSTLDGAYDLTFSDDELTFSGPVGASSAPSSLTATSSTMTTIAGGSIQAAGAISFSGPAEISTTSTNVETPSSIAFNGTLDGAEDLTLAGSAISLNGAVGHTIPLTSLSTSSPLSISGGEISCTGDISLLGPVELSTLATEISTSGSIHCSKTVDGAVALTLSAGSIALDQALGGTIPLSSLSATATANVTVAAITTSSGNISLQPGSGSSSGSLQNIPDGILTLSGALDAGTGDILLSATGRSSPLSVATIVGRPTSGTLVMSGGHVTFGSNESMTVFGSVQVSGSNTIQIGETLALGSISLNSPAIAIYLQQPSQIYSFSGTLYSNPYTSISTPSGSSLTFSSAPTFTGSGAAPLLGPINYTASALLPLLTYSGYTLNFNAATAINNPYYVELGQIAVEWFGVCASEMFYKLPIEWVDQHTIPPSNFAYFEGAMPIRTDKNRLPKKNPR